MRYNKLVRDKIPEIIKFKGGKPVTHIANNQEYWTKLKEKLSEEIEEFLKSEAIEELADIQEVLSAVCIYKDISKQGIERIRKKKAEDRGTFEKRIILEES